MRGVSISNFLIFIKFLFFFTNYDRFQALVFDKFAKEKIIEYMISWYALDFVDKQTQN